MKLIHILLLALLMVAGSTMAADSEEVNYLELAALMLRDGNLDRAIIALDQVDLEQMALEQTDSGEGNSDLLRYYTLRGMAHLRRDEPEAAVDAFEKAVNTGIAESVVYIYLAQVYFQLERYTDVLATLDSAGPSLDRISSVYHMRAQCNWLLDQYALALATLDVANEVFPEDKTFLRRKVFFLVELGLFQEAVEQGRVYLRESEGSLKDYVALGNALRAGGEVDEAIELLEQNQLSEVLATDAGFAFILLEQITPSENPTAEQIKSVREQLALRIQRLAMQRMADELLADADVVVMDRALHWSWKSAP